MPTRTLYVSDDDERQIWKVAEELSDVSFSRLVSIALEKDLVRIEKINALKSRMNRQIFTYYDKSDGIKMKKAFIGTWLVQNEEIGTLGDVMQGTMEYYTVALTQKDQLLVLITDKEQVGDYWVFRNFAEMARFDKLFRGLAPYTYDQVLLKLGDMLGEEYSEYLDI